MQDEAKKRGIKIDVKKLENFLGYPVLLTVARDGSSLKNMLNVFTSISMEGYGPSEKLQAHIAKAKEIESTVTDEKARQEQLIELRYAFIDEILRESVTFSHVGTTTSEKIDHVLANGILAIPAFLLIMYAVFQITFEWIGQPIADFVDELVNDQFLGWASETLADAGVADWMQSLVCDGIIIIGVK